MTRIREHDTSALPAAARQPDGHTHPLPALVRRALLVFAVCLALAFAGLFALFLDARQAEARRTAYVDAEFDRRTALRMAADRELQARIDQEERARKEQSRALNVLICAYVATDLPQTARRQALLDGLRCGAR